MAVHRRLEPAAPWVELVATQQDWDAADPELLHDDVRPAGADPGLRGVRARARRRAGLIHGPAHSSIGQEGGAVGSVLALTSADPVNGSHRGHHQFLAKALHHVAPEGHRPRPRRSPTTSATCCCARWPRSAASTAASATAAAARCTCSGRRPARSAPTPSSAAACRWRPGPPGPHRQAGTDAVAVTYFGDGAINIGSTLETFNLAAAWKLPLCFFIENNRYAVSTSVDEATGEPRLSGARPRLRHPQLEGRRDGPARRLPGDAGGASRTCAPAAARRSVEADVYRYFHQNGAFPGSAFGYRTKEEEQEWRAPRPDRPGVAPHLVRRGLLDRGRRRRRDRRGARADGRDRRRAARAAARRAGRASAGSARPSGPTPASSTSACAAT